MSKADSIKDIRFKLRKLCDITDELMENLTKLHDSVHNGSFIPETLNQKMTDGLRSISQLQTEIFQEYASLEIGDLPDYIEEMETVLSEYQKKLEEQQDITVRFYEHVIDRFGREKARELDRLMLELESVLRDELNLMNNQEKGGEADE